MLERPHVTEMTIDKADLEQLSDLSGRKPLAPQTRGACLLRLRLSGQDID
jgi:hypothetical protein